LDVSVVVSVVVVVVDPRARSTTLTLTTTIQIANCYQRIAQRPAGHPACRIFGTRRGVDSAPLDSPVISSKLLAAA
jgi:hypothetical protein